MNPETFKPKLRDALRLNLNIDASEEQIEQLFIMSERLEERNKIMNLTAITDEDGVIFKHIVDSLMISAFVPENSTLVDVGCGAGFPTLPLAIMRPDLRICALDSTEKRVKYVAETAEMLGLSNVSTLVGRAEELAHDKKYRERFDCATARAVASMPVLAELTLPLVRVGGTLVAMKAKSAREELDGAREIITRLAGKESFAAASLADLTIIGGAVGETIGEARTVITIPKHNAMPTNYPRKYSQIKKSNEKGKK